MMEGRFPPSHGLRIRSRATGSLASRVTTFPPGQIRHCVWIPLCKRGAVRSPCGVRRAGRVRRLQRERAWAGVESGDPAGAVLQRADISSNATSSAAATRQPLTPAVCWHVEGNSRERVRCQPPTPRVSSSCPRVLLPDVLTKSPLHTNRYLLVAEKLPDHGVHFHPIAGKTIGKNRDSSRDQRQFLGISPRGIHSYDEVSAH